METGPVDRNTPVQTTRAAVPTRNTAAPLRSQTDQVEWSEQAMDLLRQMARPPEEKSALECLLRPWEQEDDEAGSALEETMKVMKACSKIAANIRSGDRVPPEDLRYLIKHDPKLYMMAMAAREMKEDPEKCKKVVHGDEERTETPASDAASAGEGTAANAPTVEQGGDSGGASDGAAEGKTP